MKPVELILKNIGPFLDERIDFSELDTLFLISGNTGAGKTFIFDAMTFALYGKLKGNRANCVQELRSKYAEDGSETFVEFVFEAAGKKYRVHRTVPYTLVNSKGRLVTKPSEVDFCGFEGGEFISFGEKTEATNGRIQEIIGLAADEFAQVVLLPQGAFAEFLKQSSKERRDTLAKLFPVSWFSDLMVKTRENARRREEELSVISRQIALSSQNNDFSNAQEKLSEMEAKIAELHKKESSLIEKRKEIASKKAVLEEKFAAAETAAASRKRLSELAAQKSQFDELEKQNERAQRALELDVFIRQKEDAEKRLFAAQKNFESAQSRYEKITQDLDALQLQAERISKLKEDTENLKKNVLQQKSRLDDAQKYTLSNAVPPELRETLRSLNDEYRFSGEEHLSEVKNEKDKSRSVSINEELADACALLQKAAERDGVVLRLSESREELEVLKKSADSLFELLERNRRSGEQAEAALERQNLLNMAYTVSKSLLPGEPCPVCGAVDHPKPVCSDAHKDILSFEEQVQTFRQNEKKLDESYQQKLQDIRAAESKIEMLEKQAEPFAAVPETSFVKEQYVSLVKTYFELNVRCRAAQSKIAAAETEIAQFSESLNSLSRSAAGAKAAFENAEAQVKLLSDERREKAALLEEKIGKSVFSGVDEAKNCFIESSLLERQKERCRRYADEVKKCEGLVESTAAIDSAENVRAELDALVADERCAENDFNAVRNDTERLEREHTAYSSAFNTVQELERQYEKLSAEFKPYKKLSEDLNGSNPSKLQFDSWALGVYFEQVVSYASRRFFDISSGRFQFLLDSGGKTGKGYKGLDLLVTDSFTGCTRDPATLSGGETFEASISLALAITDVVQNQNGAVSLDSLFIDEGFGSLDGETLDKAMEILNELQETKMIGIISHVESLQQTVRSRIDVEKTNCGSHIRIRKG